MMQKCESVASFSEGLTLLSTEDAFPGWWISAPSCERKGRGIYEAGRALALLCLLNFQL